MRDTPHLLYIQQVGCGSSFVRDEIDLVKNFSTTKWMKVAFNPGFRGPRGKIDTFERTLGTGWSRYHRLRKVHRVFPSKP